ncbi:acyltransferase [Mesorhizobium sp. BR1-1-12]|uniref:acyltransferase family protein n=1 Tax=unclassified Mesorhizobium TaxID=325217 RepID=UPI001CCBCAF7|nr:MULTISPECIES: acyltransferase [unclassified Mesorhizobium]MBZ9919095.1 acyltransferase [Mesorhizobium sp. BR1-1-7]MBZ9970126.1 acyltransferase [Mesorhizobium sp. BR1-1-12]
MKERSAALDGLRGVAAVAVIFYHSILVSPHLVSDVLHAPVQTLSGADIVAKVVLALVSGSNAVLLFFVLSGFVLKLSFDKMSGTAGVVAYNFVIRRLCRLFPAVFFAMAFLSVLSWLCIWLGSGLGAFESGSDLELVLQNALLWKVTVNGATWTIQAELIAIPFLLSAFVISTIGGLAGSIGCFIYALCAMGHPNLLGGALWMPYSLAAFMAGMVGADARLKPLFALANQHALVSIVAALVAIKLFFLTGGLAVRTSNVLLSMALVGGVYHASTAVPFVRLLNSRLAQYLGKVSYSLYLVNVPIIWVFMWLAPALGLDHLGALERGLVTGFLVALCSLPVAALSESVFEQGGISLGRALSIRSVARSSALSPAD